ncbi:MAG TPA: TerB family tellurite resistance protein [Flavisolibacter sp.]|nr:TerB family tellurite resistance protein [Flavisolibacter sp.]
MKGRVMFGLLLGLLFAGQQSRGQVQEVQQLLLNVEKLAQLKSILEDLRKGYQIVSKGYTTIRDLSQGNFNLHQVFLDGLLEVSPVVKNYRRIGEIIQTQIRLVQEYKRAYRQFAESGWLTGQEVEYLKTVYGNLLQKSIQNLESLAMVITAGALRMSDDERLSAIDATWQEITDILNFLRHFHQETKLLLLQRQKEGKGLEHQRKLFSLNK